MLKKCYTVDSSHRISSNRNPCPNTDPCSNNWCMCIAECYILMDYLTRTVAIQKLSTANMTCLASCMRRRQPKTENPTSTVMVAFLPQCGWTGDQPLPNRCQISPSQECWIWGASSDSLLPRQVERSKSLLCFHQQKQASSEIEQKFGGKLIRAWTEKLGTDDERTTDYLKSHWQKTFGWAEAPNMGLF